MKHLKEFTKQFISDRKDKLSNYKMIMDIVVYLNEISNSGAINNIKISGNYVSEGINDQRNNKENKYTNFIVTKENRAMVGYTGNENEELVIPGTITNEAGINYKVAAIGSDAFCDCTNLKSVTIPESVTYIGDYAFNGCDNLTTINIDNNVDGIDDANDCKPWGATNATINWLRTFTDFTLTAENRAMIGYTDTTDELIIPSTFTGDDGKNYKVVGIDPNAFSDCTNLKSVTIPNTIVDISTCAFAKCTSLKWGDANATVYLLKEPVGFTVKSDNRHMVGYTGNENEELVIPATFTNDGKNYKVVDIGDYAFSDCTNLKSVTIPDTVTCIGDCAFLSCESLSSITIPDSVNVIGDNAFRRCKSLTSITIPNSVTILKSKVFKGCELLKSIDLPYTISIFGLSMFEDCTSLTSVTLPNNITDIPNYTFYNCESLSSIIIPDSVKSISHSAFSYCALTSIDIPEGVTEITSSAFMGCTNLTTINVDNVVDAIIGSPWDATNATVNWLKYIGGKS